MSSYKAVPLTCHGHSRPITHLSFSTITDDEQFYIISACKDNNPMLRDGVTGDWIGTFFGHKGAVWQARLSTDSQYAITGSADFTAKVWDPHTGECLHTMTHAHIVRAVAVPHQANPTTVATGGFEKKLRIFDLAHATSRSPSTSTNATSTSTSSTSAAAAAASDPNAGNTKAPSTEIGAGIHGGTIKSILWGADRNTLLTAADDGVLRWWDLRAPTPAASATLDGALGSCELNTIPNHNNNDSPASAAAAVLSVAAGTSAYFFAAAAPGRLIKRVRTAQPLASVALHLEQGKFVVGGSADTWVRVFSFEEERELELQKGHHGPIWSAAFAPDGKAFATGSEDGTVKLWKFTKEPYGLWRQPAAVGEGGERRESMF